MPTLANIQARVSPLVLAMVVFLSLRVPWLFSLIERDEGLFGYVGYVFITGGAPYQDVVDHSGMLLYTFYGLSHWLFGAGVIPLRIVVILMQLGVVWGLYRLAKSWFDEQTATMTVLLFALFANIPVFESHNALSESLSVPFMVWGMVAYDYWRRNERGTGWYALAWLLIAIASAVRLSLAFGGIMLAVVVTFETLLNRDETWLMRIRHLFWRGFVAFAMVALVWGLSALVMFQRGSLDDFIRIFYESVVYISNALYPPIELRILYLQQGLPMFALSVLGLIALLRRVRSLRRGTWILIWWTLVFGYVVTRPQMWGHYFIQIIPMLSVLGAVGLLALVRWSGRLLRDDKRGILLAGTIVGGMLFSTVYFALPQYPNMQPFFGGDPRRFHYADSFSYADQMAMSHTIQRLMADARKTNPNARLFVYGNSPLTYWLANEYAPRRDTFSINYYDWVVHEHNDLPLFEQVKQPEIEIIVVYDLYVPDVLNDTLYYVHTHYEQVERIGGATIHRRLRLP